LGEVLTADETAGSLGLHVETVRQAIRSHLIKRLHTCRQYLIPRDELAKFRKTFVSSTALAAEVDTNTRCVVDLFEELAIAPALRPGKDRRCRVTLYRRTDVPTDLRQRLDRRFPHRLARSHQSSR
jgi:excisionase family DNA binding protein